MKIEAKASPGKISSRAPALFASEPCGAIAPAAAPREGRRAARFKSASKESGFSVTSPDEGTLCASPPAPEEGARKVSSPGGAGETTRAISPERLFSFLRGENSAGDEWLILCHRAPDGDAVGSAEGLRLMLCEIGARALCACPDPLPQDLLALTETPFLTVRELGDIPSSVTRLIAVDTADPALLDDLLPLAPRFFLKIDHHRTGRPFARYTCVDPDASATGEILTRAGRAANLLTPAASRALYAAIAADSGGFRYANTSAGTLEAAAALLRSGADSAAVNRLLFENKPLRRVRATSIGLLKTELLAGGAIALVALSREETAREGLAREDFSELSSAMREIAGVELSLRLLQDEREDLVHLSCRSKMWFDCTALAARFGGGGHLRASGATLATPSLVDATLQVRKAAVALFAEGNPRAGMDK